VQDGVVRLEFLAGDVAINDLEEKARILKEVAQKLGVNPEEVPEAVENLFEEWKKKRKELRRKRNERI